MARSLRDLAAKAAARCNDAVKARFPAAPDYYASQLRSQVSLGMQLGGSCTHAAAANASTMSARNRRRSGPRKASVAPKSLA